jgi:hypothetical protein
MSEPTRTSSSPISEEDRRGFNEQEGIRLGVAAVTLAWANIENYLAMLLARIIRDEGSAIASAIYFTPTGTTLRIKVVDRALRSMAAGSAVEVLLLAKWKPLRTELDNLWQKRNEVAHGQLLIVGGADGSNSAKLITAPALRFAYHKMESSLESGKISGLGASELENSATEMKRVGRQIREFADCVMLLQQGDICTLRKRLVEEVREN